MENDVLYHYTSINTLVLILKNKNIRFNTLAKVDDMDEGITSDLGDVGRFIFVSCWTDEKRELIPLWNLYTPDMHGVRISLPKFPFKKYHYNIGELNFSEQSDIYIYILNMIEICIREITSYHHVIL